MRLRSRDIGCAGKRSVSTLAFVTAAANGTGFSIGPLVMATNGNSSSSGMGDIIQLNVGGTR